MLSLSEVLHIEGKDNLVFGVLQSRGVHRKTLLNGIAYHIKVIKVLSINNF
jgi:hypothetical protein